MIKSNDITPDTYKSGAFLRRWSINENGQAVCVEDAYPTSNPITVEPTSDEEGNDTTAEAQAASDADYQAMLDAQTAKNAKIAQALAEVEALETAKRVIEPSAETAKTITETDIDGNETTKPQAEWAAYDAAQETISNASDETINFEVVRKGKPSETLPVMKSVEKTVTDEEGNESTETVEEVDTEAEPEENPEFEVWQTAFDAVSEDLK
tara:strand:- start:8506 stop:9135 length:630 start_codon:yes stop_codon:yes gene_type:complete